ncbi:MAG: response regulator transcription factor [Actinomycetota bacterium]
MTDADPIRVVIADDQELVRSGFRALIDAEPGLAVVGQAADGIEAVEQAHATRPHVILMDVRMPEMDGLAATARITADERLADCRVLVLTTFDLDAYVYDALAAGASGFLLKDTAPQHLLDAIRTVAAGDALLAPSVTRRLIAEFVARPTPQASDELEVLTDRERDVLAQIGRGSSNAEIAETLHISPLTVKTHVSRILTKLNRRDRAQLVVVAYEAGLVVPGQGAGSNPSPEPPS